MSFFFKCLRGLHIKFRFLSENVKLIVFNTITVAGAAAVYISIGFVPEDYPMLTIGAFAMVNIVTGAASGGFYRCAVLYARLVASSIVIY